MAVVAVPRAQLDAEVFQDGRYVHRTWGKVEPTLGLLPHEVRLLEWAAAGLSDPAMARRASTEHVAVRTCWKRLLQHLEVSSRAAAVAKALRAGVIQ